LRLAGKTQHTNAESVGVINISAVDWSWCWLSLKQVMII